MKHSWTKGCGGTPAFPAAVIAVIFASLCAQPFVEAQDREGGRSRWSKLTNRTVSPFEREKVEEERKATSRDGSPYNPKFGPPAFEMPETPAQDATGPDLKQFHPTEEATEDGPVRKFLERGEEPDPRKAAEKREDLARGRKVTLSHRGEEEPSRTRRRTYDDIYQSKSPYALPKFEMPTGPTAALAGEPAQGTMRWGGRSLERYHPEMELKGLEKARKQRAQQEQEKEEAKRRGERPDFFDLFDRTRKLENR